MNASRQKVAMITGAAGSLGRAAESAFALAGYRRIVCDVDEGALKRCYPDDPRERFLLPLDLTDTQAVEQGVAAAAQALGAVDVLCNITGGFHYGDPVHQMQLDVWRHMMDLNATTMINAVRAVVPFMVSAGRGTIINVGAAAHQRGQAHMGAYGAAKGAVARLTESMAEELRKAGIGVFCVMPEIIDTPANRTDMPTADTSNWTPAPAIAELMLLLAADAAFVMSGGSFPVKGRPPLHAA